MRRFLITGCGRSGTKYMAELMGALGISCGHELVFTSAGYDGEWGDWPTGESSSYAPPLLDKLPSDVVVFHVVRNPLHVVRSILARGGPSQASLPLSPQSRRAEVDSLQALRSARVLPHPS